MTAQIDHKDQIDVRDLAELAREQGEILEDAEADPYEREDAVDTLEALSRLLADCGYAVDADDAEEIADVLDGLSDSGDPTLIADHYFVTAMEQLTKDIGILPENLPDYVVIDWDATAENLEVDYSAVDLDGKEYLIRLG